MEHPLILASQSPRRREYLALLQRPYTCVSPEVDETLAPGLSPHACVMQLAQRKARAVARGAQPHALCIGADTVVVHAGKILGKPRDEADAFAMLSKLQNDIHQVYTGVCICEAGTGRETCSYRATQVQFAPMTPQEIRAYIATGEPMDKAGAYGIQGLGAVYITGICGCYYNVVGLPIALVRQMLLQWEEEAEL